MKCTSKMNTHGQLKSENNIRHCLSLFPSTRCFFDNKIIMGSILTRGFKVMTYDVLN